MRQHKPGRGWQLSCPSSPAMLPGTHTPLPSPCSQRILPLHDADARLPQRVFQGQAEQSPGWARSYWWYRLLGLLLLLPLLHVTLGRSRLHGVAPLAVSCPPALQWSPPPQVPASWSSSGSLSPPSSRGGGGGVGAGACTRMYKRTTMSLNLDPSLTLGAVPAPEAAEGPLQLFPLYPAHGELGECLACHWLGWGWDKLGTVCDKEESVSQVSSVPSTSTCPGKQPGCLGTRALAESHHAGWDGEASSGQLPRSFPTSPHQPLLCRISPAAGAHWSPVPWNR